MANWCNNIVAFEGEETALEQVKAIFLQMAIREGEENCGQLPEFLKAENGGYFFNIVWEEGNCIISYDTRWSPNTDTLIKIAERYSLDFVHDYEEMGNLLFGRAVYEDGNLREIDWKTRILASMHIPNNPTPTFSRERNTNARPKSFKSFWTERRMI